MEAARACIDRDLSHMRRNFVSFTLMIAGAALLCLAALDWVDYQRFVVFLRWR